MQQEKYSMLEHLQLAVISRNKNGLKYFNNVGKHILYQCSNSPAQAIGTLLKFSKMQHNGFFDKEQTNKDAMTDEDRLSIDQIMNAKVFIQHKIAEQNETQPKLYSINDFFCLE